MSIAIIENENVQVKPYGIQLQNFLYGIPMNIPVYVPQDFGVVFGYGETSTAMEVVTSLNRTIIQNVMWQEIAESTFKEVYYLCFSFTSSSRSALLYPIVKSGHCGPTRLAVITDGVHQQTDTVTFHRQNHIVKEYIKDQHHEPVQPPSFDAEAMQSKVWKWCEECATASGGSISYTKREVPTFNPEQYLYAGECYMQSTTPKKSCTHRGRETLEPTETSVETLYSRHLIQTWLNVDQEELYVESLLSDREDSKVKKLPSQTHRSNHLTSRTRGRAIGAAIGLGLVAGAAGMQNIEMSGVKNHMFSAVNTLGHGLSSVQNSVDDMWQGGSKRYHSYIDNYVNEKEPIDYDTVAPMYIHMQMKDPFKYHFGSEVPEIDVINTFVKQYIQQRSDPVLLPRILEEQARTIYKENANVVYHIARLSTFWIVVQDKNIVVQDKNIIKELGKTLFRIYYPGEKYYDNTIIRDHLINCMDYGRGKSILIGAIEYVRPYLEEMEIDRVRVIGILEKRRETQKEDIKQMIKWCIGPTFVALTAAGMHYICRKYL
jgi:hypothetical protein